MTADYWAGGGQHAAPKAPGASQISVLQLITVLAVGGTERQFVNLVNGMDRRRYRVHLGCFRRWGRLLAELRGDLPLSEYPIGKLYALATARQLAALRADLREQNIQIVHTYGFYPNVFGLAAAGLAGTAVKIASVRDRGHNLSRAKWALQRLALKYADAVVVNARVLREQLLKEGVHAERVVVIHNGIDDERFARPPRGALHRVLSLPPGTPVVGVVCRVSRVKWLEGFIRAASLISGEHPDVRFLIMGDAPVKSGDTDDYLPELKREARQCGLEDRLIFARGRTDVQELLSDLAISVLPSLSEGLSNTLLESQAAGVPVVATDVGGNAEIIDHGRTGLLVPSRDVAALASAMAALLADRAAADQMGRAGQKRVRAHFSTKRMIEQTQTLYERLWLDAERKARRR